MRMQGSGVIVNVSSGTALMQFRRNGDILCSERALAQISKTEAIELKDKHIAVPVVYPYITLTDFEKNTIKDPRDNTAGANV